MKKKEIGITMLKVYEQMIDKKAQGLLIEAEKADCRVRTKATMQMVTKKGIFPLWREAIETEKKLAQLQSKMNSLEKEVLSHFDTKSAYCYDWKRTLEDIASKDIVLPSDTLKNKIEDIKDQMRLAGCADEVRAIFSNLANMLK